MAIVKSLINLTSSSWAFIQKRPVYLALSGGKDSVVLLDALMQQWPIYAPYPLTLLHVNHHLQADAALWAKHCQSLANRYNLPCHVLDIQLDSPDKNIESQARHARYTALFDAMSHNGVLLVAQHADDQVETLFLQLKRGAGLTGLSGMVPWQSGFQQFGADPSMHIYRPLLDVTQAQINAYAVAHLSPNDWVDDPSNTDTQFDRNFLRNDVIPLLSLRWKQWTKKVVQSMLVLNDEHTLLSEVTQERLFACLNADKLLVNKLTTYSSLWQKQIVRHFALEIANVALSQAQLQQLCQIIHAKADARGRLSVKDNTNELVHFERFQGQLYVIKEAHITAARASMTQLQNNIQDMSGSSIDESDFSVKVVSQSYPIKPVGASYSKPIKQWYKQWGIAPWERSFTLIKTRDDIDISLWCNGRTYELTKDE